MPCSASVGEVLVAAPAGRGSRRGCADAASSRGRRASPGSRSRPRPSSRASPASSSASAVPPLATSSNPSSASPRANAHDAGLVVDGDQRAHSSRTTFGSSRCSAACTRSRSVSTVSPGSTGTGSLAITSPVSTPSSTKCTVAAAAGAPAASTSSSGCAPGNSRKRRRMDVHDPLREAREERRPQQVHVAGADDELDAAAVEPVRHRGVARVAVRVLARAGTSRSRRPRRSARASARAPSTFDATATTGRLGVEQRLQVRPLARDEHADHARTILPITSSSPGSRTTATIPDPEVEHAPELVLGDVAREPREDGRSLPRAPVDLGAQPVRDDAREVSEDPAARHVRERVRAVAQAPHVVEVEPRRREEVVAACSPRPRARGARA